MSHKNTPSLLSILILLAASLPVMLVPAAGAPKAAALRAAELESEIAELKATIAELEQTLEDKAEQVTALRQTSPEPEPESSSATEAPEPAGDEILTAELPTSSEEVAEEEVAQAPQSLGNPPLSKDQPLAGQEYQQFQDYYDEFLNLGVRRDYQAVERYNTVEQINTFIPPLYQPAFVGHGYVLPPGAMRVSAGFSFIDVNPDDFFKGGKTDFVHENHGVNRLRADVDFLYGLDHNMTLRLNVPYLSSRSTGSVHPAGVKTMDLFAEGSTQAIGDASLMLKKKWVDQGNFLFNFATVTGIKLPNGSDQEEFDQHLVVKTPDGALGTAFGGGPFPRFTDDGSLPQVLQPGTGGLGYILGFMGTRQLLRPRAAIHAGTLLRFLTEKDGVDPGNEVRFFASFVKPVFKEQVSLDLTFNGMKKSKDSYDGLFGHPVPNPDGSLKGFAMTPRPAFQGGTVAFFSPSVIWSPQPQLRLVLSASFRLNQPELGPWPGHILQLGVTYTFPFYRQEF